MTVTDLHPAPTTAEPSLDELAAWVKLMFVDVLERRASNTLRWCQQWHQHPEVVTRMRVLYASWVQVTVHGDALAYSSWVLDHLDRHLAAMQVTSGPFAACSEDRHTPHKGLSVEAPRARGELKTA
jgi:hypothetical protein